MCFRLTQKATTDPLAYLSFRFFDYRANSRELKTFSLWGSKRAFDFMRHGEYAFFCQSVGPLDRGRHPVQHNWTFPSLRRKRRPLNVFSPFSIQFVTILWTDTVWWACTYVVSRHSLSTALQIMAKEAKAPALEAPVARSRSGLPKRKNWSPQWKNVSEIMLPVSEVLCALSQVVLWMSLLASDFILIRIFLDFRYDIIMPQGSTSEFVGGIIIDDKILKLGCVFVCRTIIWSWLGWRATTNEWPLNDPV